MFTTFSTALSALSAHATAIDVTGNNLANLNTPGFKAVEATFHDLMAQSVGVGGGAAQVGMGVGQVGTHRIFTQGAIQTTNSPTHAAIQGNGFFVVKDGADQTLYTRAGNFQFNAAGELVTATGQKVQGWSAVDGVVKADGPIGNIVAAAGGMAPARTTTTLALGLNLNAGAPTTGAGSTFSAPVQVVDSLGSTHTLTVTFTKTDANTWSYDVTIPGQDVGETDATSSLGDGELVFDSSGKLTAAGAPVTIQISGLANGAADMEIAWNLADASGQTSITQISAPSAVSKIQQNGVTAGQLTSVGLENGGYVVAQFSNGQKTVVGQIALATFANPESLIAVGNNALQAAATTSAAVVGAPGSAGRGEIVAGAVESSTTDIAEEFTRLMTYQRGYQAASRVISITDQLMQETVNLIRG